MPLSIFAAAAVAWLSYIGYDFLNHPDSPSTQISAQSASGDWPMFQRDPAHSGFASELSFKPKGEIRWIYETGSRIVASPVVAGRAVFLSTNAPFDYKIVALDADTGGLLWQRPVSAPIDRSLAVAGGLLFASMRDGLVVALSPSDGAVQWEFHADTITFTTPTIYGGLVYIGAWNKKLYLLDAATGELLWERDVDARVTSNPVVNDTVFAFRAANNRVYVLDARSGRPRTDYPIRETLGSLALSGDRLYYADTKGALRAVDWTKFLYPLETKIRAIRLNLFAWGLGSLPAMKGSVWNRNRPSERFLGTPTVADGMVYVASESGKVFKVQEFDGEPVWIFDAGAEPSKTVSVTADQVFVGDVKGRLHVIDVDTGEAELEVKLDGPITTGPVVAGDTIYVATLSGKLYAVE